MRKKLWISFALAGLSCCLAATGMSALKTNAETDLVTVTTAEMLAAINAEGKDEDGKYGKTVETEVFSYKIGYGNVDAGNNAVDFSAYEVYNGGLRTSAVYNAQNYQCSVLLAAGTLRAMQYSLADGVKTEGNFNPIFALTMKSDASVVITNGAGSGSTSFSVCVYRQTETGLETLLTKEMTASVAENELGGTFSFQTGETLLYEFKATCDKNTEARLADKNLHPTFSVMKLGAFDSAKNSAKAALTAAKNALEASEYEPGDYTALEGIYDKALEDVEAITQESDVAKLEEIRAAAENEAADYLKLSEAAGYRTATAEKLNVAISALNEADYLAESWNKIQAEKSALESNISSLTRKSLIDAQYTASMERIAAIAPDAPVEEVSVSVSALVNGIVALGNEGGGYSGKATNPLFDCELGYGRVGKSLGSVEMNAFEKSSSGLRTEKVYTGTYEAALVLSDGRIRVSNFYLNNGENVAFNGNVIFKFTAKDNLKFTVTHPADAAYAGVNVKAYKSEQGGLYLLKSTSLDTAPAENAYGGEWTVARGDVFFFEYSFDSETLSSRTLAKAPVFKAEIIEESELVSAIPDESALAALNKTTLEMITEECEYGGDAVRAQGISWQLLHGTAEDAKTFELIGNSILQSEAKNPSGYRAIYAANADNKFVRTHIDAEESFIIKFTANTNVKISVNSEAWTNTQYSLAATYTTIVAHYDEAGEKWYYSTVQSKSVSWPSSVDEGFLAEEIHLTEGDVMFYLIAGPNHTTNITLLPSFRTDVNGYEASKATDMTAFIEAQKLIPVKQAALEEEYEALEFDEYTMDDYLCLCDLYEAAIENLTECKTTEEIDALIEKLHADAADYLKLSEAEGVREEILAKFQAKIDERDSGKYRQETWESILGLKEELAEQLKNLTSRKAMNERLAESEERLAAISEDKTEAGCGSFIGAGTLAALSALTAVGFALKKKRNA